MEQRTIFHADIAIFMLISLVTSGGAILKEEGLDETEEFVPNIKLAAPFTKVYENGRTCEGGKDKLCNVKSDTSTDGDPLEDACKDFCGIGSDVHCVFNNKLLIAECHCTVDTKKFDRKNEVCRTSCETDQDCGEHGWCTEMFCECNHGYEGDDCKVITGCKELEDKCKKANATCVFDVTAGINASCKCKQPNYVYDPDTEQCKDCGCQNGGTCQNDGSCTCMPGTTGHKCENGDCNIVSPECEESGGMCKYNLYQNVPYCECVEEKIFHYQSRKCEDKCQEGECQNGGLCNELGICACLTHISGRTCEIVDCNSLIPKCKESGGACKYSDKDKRQYCDCSPSKVFKKKSEQCEDCGCQNGGTCKKDGSCSCMPGTTGHKCENGNCTVISPECEESGGECKYNLTQKSPYCECLEEMIFHYDSRKCEVDYCRSNPCRHDGTCENIPNDYNCSCLFPYRGKNCLENGWCDTYGRALCGTVTCQYDEVIGKGFCVCEDFKEFDKASKKCIDMDRCIKKYIDNTCNKAYETCKAGECACEDNYKYNDDKSRCKENFCASTKCPQNSKCKELGLGNVHCECDENHFMKGKECVKINPCSLGLSSCTQQCNRFTSLCSCKTEFQLDDDHSSCKIKNKNLACESDCGVGSCFKISGKNTCICPEATHVLMNGTCIDICTAEEKLPKNTCPTDKCELMDGKPQYRCICEDLYEQDKDGIHCKRKVMCEDSEVIEICEEKSALCKENATTDIGYECVCDVGFEEEDGICKRKCDTNRNRNACASLNAVCELDYAFAGRCKCPPLLARERNVESKPCNMIAPYSYLGRLSVPRKIYDVKEHDKRSKLSNNRIDLPKLGFDIKESLKKVYGEINDLKILDCDNTETVLTCTIEMQLQKRPKDIKVIASPTVCIPINDNFCIVKPSVILRREEKQDLFWKTEPCSKEITSKLCGVSTNCILSNNGNDFQCNCKKGFKVIGSYRPVTSNDTIIEKCNDIDECEIPSICPPTTYCVNLYGDYECYCKDGYKKKNANANPKYEGCDALCSPDPCVKGTCTPFGNHGFSCRCHEPFTGEFCNETTVQKSLVPDHKIAIIIGGILGTMIVILLIIEVLVFRKMRAKKNDEYKKYRQRSILSDRNRMGQNQNRNGRDEELHHASGSQSARYRRDSGEYRRGYRVEQFIPRVQTSRR